jgi:hypothetical protein
LRYIAPESNPIVLAELSLFQKTGKNLVDINGKPIDQLNDKNIRKVFDNDYETYYANKTNGSWLGKDFNRVIESQNAIIEFWPRNDVNVVIPGNTYELFFWNHKWETLGIKEAIDFYVEYKTIPEGALLWLHCLNGGTEERLFTYENGIINWW